MMRRCFQLFLMVCLFLPNLPAQRGGELRFCLRAEPKTFNPVIVTDEPSEIIRYLTGGVLLRVNRQTQQVEPELAVSWKILQQGRKINFKLREGLSFSDGTPFSAEDVAYTIRTLMDPALHSPTADSFRSSAGPVKTTVSGTYRVAITFPAPVAGLERLFDQVAILSSRSPRREMAVLGPFFTAEYKPGAYVLLKRNAYYWKRDENGESLPYLDSIRLEIQQNREIEFLRLERGQIHLIDRLDPEFFDRLAAESPSSVHDAGPSLNSEQMWFNQVPTSPIPAYKKVWFESRNFRRAISESIHREDICRVVYHQHASPAVGPVSPANRFWFNAALKPHPFDPRGALRRLEEEGFRLQGGVLRDRGGHPVEFSLITNSGNKPRELMAAMIQQDLGQLGIRLNVVTLDFSSLIERISQTFDYEACLLGLVNVDLDPNSQMNVWLSSASNHQWNPNQKSPATNWEAEMDRLMRAQASVIDAGKRKAYFDQVQQIVWEEAPFIYLVNTNSLSAASPSLRNVSPIVMLPQTSWNAERLCFASQTARSQP